MRRFVIATAEPALVAVAAPLLLFPRGWLPWLGLALLPVSWLMRRLGTGRWLVDTPFDRPIAIIFLMLPIALYASVDLSLSMPKLYGILLSFAVFYTTVSYVRSERRFAVALGLLTASIVAISALGLVGTEWIPGKYALPHQVYRLFPRLITEVQSSVGTSAGFQPNEVGGTLGFLLPLAVALLLRVRLSWPVKAALALAILLGCGVLALSASRSAAFGLSVALLVLVIWRWRRAGLALLLVAAIALGVAVGSGALDILGFLLKIDIVSSAPGDMQGRFEVWGRALNMIEDFPFTGIGLNTYPTVLRTLYPTLLADAGSRIPHAHNIFLQTAVDLGLGGLLAFLGLSAIAAHVGWQAHRQTRAKDRGMGLGSPEPASGYLYVQAAIVGILLGLLSFLVFGLANAISLGAKPTVLLWLMMGLIVAAHRLTSHQEQGVSTFLLRGGVRIGPMRRASGPVLAIAGEAYWTAVFFLVAMGYLVTALEISGWIP